MTEANKQYGRGAPLRALFMVAVIWVFGRVAWEVFAPNPAVISNVVTKSSPSGRLQVERKLVVTSGLRMFGSSVEPFPITQNAMLSSQKPKAAIYQQARVDLVSINHRYPFSIAHARVDSLALNPMLSPVGGSSEHAVGDPDKFLLRPGITTNQTSINAQNPSGKGHGAGDNNSRISGNFWLYLRQNSRRAANNIVVAPRQFPNGQYGASQIGANLSYRIIGELQSGLSIFGRVSSPISVSGQEEAALGLTVKPSSKIPISLYAEQRFAIGSDANSGPAIYAAGGIGPQRLLEDVQLEAYGQAGYVFGRADSYFFDGAATIQKEILTHRRKKLSLGGGVWTGGQKGISRLDIGPRASATIPVGGLATRISVDWRQRVAGNAEPDSGVAVTITTGF